MDARLPGTLALVGLLSAGCGAGAGAGAAAEGGPAGRVELTYHFGVVRPGATLVHRFRIRNTGATPWTFATFHTDCSCTASEPTAPMIGPGSEEEVAVTYRAPLEASDPLRRVGVEFREPEAPRVWLEVRARVRPEFAVSPERVAFRRVAEGKSAEQVVEVANYGGEPWPGLEVRSSAPWLSVALAPLGVAEGPNEPRQRWRVTALARAEGLPPGRHRATLGLARRSGGPAVEVPIELDLMAPVSAVPSQMFFGNLTGGRPADQTVLIRFASPADAPDVGQVHLGHDLGDCLALAWRRREAAFWELSATLDPGDRRGEIRGAIRIDFPGALPDMVIPVIALARGAGP